MKNILLFVVLAIAGCWAVPKPMESIANYNILMVHGAYGPKNDDGELQGFQQLCLM